MTLITNVMVIGLVVAASAISPSVIKVHDASDIPDVLQSSNYRHIGSYEELSTQCIITQCPARTQDTIDVYNYCFKTTQCSNYGLYHCLHDSGRTVHFCADFGICKLRSVDKAVVNVNEPGIVHIYNVPCKYGQFQPNDHHSCFTDCANDTSIGILETTNNDPVPLAYCLIGCNAYGEIFFKLGTDLDDCKGTQKCLSSEDLLPDCTCEARCPPNHVRLPENNFSCSDSAEHVTPTTPKTKEAVRSTLATSNGKRGNENVHEVQSSPTDSVELETHPNAREDPISSNGHNLTIGDIIMIILAALVLVVVLVVLITSILSVLVGLITVVVKRYKSKDVYRRVAQSGSDVGHQDTRSQTNKSNTNTTIFNGPVTLVSGNHNNVNVNGACTQSEDDVESEQSVIDSPSSCRNQMELLKGTDSFPQYDTTNLKQVYTEH